MKRCSVVPSTAANTNKVKAGTVASIVARMRNAPQSASAAKIMTAQTQAIVNPSSGGVGAIATRN